MIWQAISLARFIENQSDVPQFRSDFRCVRNKIGGVMPEENAAHALLRQTPVWRRLRKLSVMKH